MSDFMLLLRDDPSQFQHLSPADMQAVIEKYIAWRRELEAKGTVTGGTKLRDEGGRVLRQNGGRLKMSDGPYAEAKEVVGGFFVIKAANYDEAAAIAETCPHAEFGSIEIREIETV